MLTLERNDLRPDQGREYETVLIENIRLHGDAEQTQLRERIDEETVVRYAEALERGEQFPLVELVPVGDGTYHIADGWHRVLAHKAAGRGVIDALILVVAPGADPLQTAIRYALRANLKHGLPLTKGDQSKRARTALLMPWFKGRSLRQLEREIKVGKSTIARVKNDLVRSGELPWTADGEPAPDYLPPEYVAEQRLDDAFGGDEELKTAAFRLVSKLDAFAPKDWEFVYADEDDPRRRYREHVILHRGLIENATVVVPVEDNEVVDGLAVRHWLEEVDEEDEGGAFRRKLSKEERDRLEEMKAKRAFFAARDRLLGYPDKELRKAVRTLAKYREMPGLWRDLQVFVHAGGPAEEHPFQDDEDMPF